MNVNAATPASVVDTYTERQRLESLDEILIRTFPSLGRFAAVAVMEMRKS